MVKINLLINSDAVLSGFLNIDPLAAPNDPNKIASQVSNLDVHVDDAEVDEFIALDIVDFLPSPSLENVLINWMKKIRHGGSITIGGVDMMMVAKAIVKQDIDLSQANLLLYGEQSAPWNYRKATLTMQSLLTIFQTNGFKIIIKRFDNYRYVITAVRP